MFTEPMTLKDLAKKMGWGKKPRFEADKLIEAGKLHRRLVYVDPARSTKRKVVYQGVTAEQVPLWS
jgi:hypothetical protein